MVQRANDTPYGLNASVWTRDARLGRQVAARLQAGTVNMNEAYAAAWGSAGAPMGGFKESGLGRRHGAQGILKYTEAQTVAEQRLLPIDTPRPLDHAAVRRRHDRGAASAAPPAGRRLKVCARPERARLYHRSTSWSSLRRA